MREEFYRGWFRALPLPTEKIDTLICNGGASDQEIACDAPILTYDEQMALFRLYRDTKDDTIKRATRHALIECNYPLVLSIANRAPMSHISFAQWVSAGQVGLILGVEGFDPERGIRPSSYLYITIVREMRQLASPEAGVITIPNYIHIKRSSLTKKGEKIDDPRLSIDVANVVEGDAVVNRNNGRGGAEAIPAWELISHTPDLVGHAHDSMVADDVALAFAIIEDRWPVHANIIREHFGFTPYTGGMTFKEMSERDGKTRQLYGDKQRLALKYFRVNHPDLWEGLRETWAVQEGAKMEHQHFSKEKLANNVTYVCKLCGVQWYASTTTQGVQGGWTGFLESTVLHHTYNCVERTPEERIKNNRAWRKRYERAEAQGKSRRSKVTFPKEVE